MRLTLLALLLTGCGPVVAAETVSGGHAASRLEPPAPVTTPRAARSHPRRHVAPVIPLRPDFAALAQCESSGNPRAISPSGKYEGLYQFDLATWRSVGGVGHPKDASPAEQTKRAWLLYLDRGRQPWPVCGRHL